MDEALVEFEAFLDFWELVLTSKASMAFEMSPSLAIFCAPLTDLSFSKLLIPSRFLRMQM